MAKREPKHLRLLLTGGGTGGHIYPLLEICRILRRDLDIDRVLYVGGRGRAEETVVTRAGIPLRCVSTAPVSGLSPGRLLPSIWKNSLGTLQAIGIVARFRPHLILASGGYVSAPVSFASFILRPFSRARLVVQEQNVMPGLMNKVGSLLAHAVMVSFPETPYFLWNNRCVYTGYPVREALLVERDPAEAKKLLGIPPDSVTLLVYGGSLGSRSINRLMTQALAGLLETRRNLFVIHSTGLGTGEYEAWNETRRAFDGAIPPATAVTTLEDGVEASFCGGRVVYRLKPYLHDIAECLAAADLVVCRAGAGTISEVSAAGKPAIVIPKRGLPGDHQELNAIHLAENNACEVLFERKGPDGTDCVDPGEFLVVAGHLLEHPERLRTLARNARRNFNPNLRESISLTLRGILTGAELDYVPEIVEPAGVRILKQADLLVDFLRQQPADSFYRRLYAIKMDEYLGSADWRVKNNGIKLAGALQRRDKLAELLRCFDTGNGFMRRNVLRALDHMGHYSTELPAILMRALDDSYFEVRAGGLSLAGRYASHLQGNQALAARMRQVAEKRLQHYDVRVQGLRVLPLFVPVREYLEVAARFCFAENARLRQAILDGLRGAVDGGRATPADLAAIRRFIGEMPVTTSDFSAQFTIRDSFLQLYHTLSDRDDSKEVRPS